MSNPSLDDVITELRHLNEAVPRPRSLPTEADMRELEHDLGLRLHEDLRRYLLEASDVVFGTKEPVTVGTGGYTDLAAVLRHATESGVPDDLIPVCEDNGDFYCVAPSGEVVFWSHNGTSDEGWANLATWIHEVWINER